MNTSEFKVVLEELRKDLAGHKCTFRLNAQHFVFRNIELSRGLSCVFTGSNISVQKFTLEDYNASEERYMNSVTKSDVYHLLTQKQASTVVDTLLKAAGVEDWRVV